MFPIIRIKPIITQILFIITVILIKVIYVQTYARFPINYADSLELITAAKLGGVAHPPGYPLYTGFLHIITNLPFVENIAAAANFTSTFFQTLSLSILLLIGIELSHIVKMKRAPKWIYSATVATLILAFSYQFWFHALIAEVFALNHVFLGLFILFNIIWLNNTKKHHWLVLAVITLGLGLSHHQTIGFVIPSWLLMIASATKTNHKNVITKLSQNLKSILIYTVIIAITFILPFTLLFYFNHNQASFSWYFEPSIKGLIDTILRRIYTHEGSAIETYAHEFNLTHSLQSIWIYLKILAKNFTIPGTFLLIPAFHFFYKKSKPLGSLLITSFLISGPLLAAYLKFPIEGTLSDAGYYAGTALRVRMFLVNFYISAVIMIIGIQVVITSLPRHRYKFPIAILIAAIPIYLLFSNYKIVDRSKVNFDHVYYQQILNDIPQDAVLIIQSDSSFGILYKHLVENVRPDLIIIPATTQMRYLYFKHLDPPIQLYEYQDETQHIIDITTWQLYQGKRVFFLEPDPETLSLLGTEGNPFFAIPSGYLIEISKEPRQIEEYNYGLTFQMFSLYTDPRNLWENATKGIFAVNHTILGYYNYKAGNDDAGIQHFIFAKDLSRSKTNATFIEKAHNQARENQNYYLNATPPTAEQYLDLYQENMKKQDYPNAYQAILRATYLDPTNTQYRQLLINSSFFQGQ